MSWPGGHYRYLAGSLCKLGDASFMVSDDSKEFIQLAVDGVEA
jgi:hypothetical protein